MSLVSRILRLVERALKDKIALGYSIVSQGQCALAWITLPLDKTVAFRLDVMSRLVAFNPIHPNPAVAARAVSPQSGRSRPEKRPFFHIFLHFSKMEPPKIGVQYIKLNLMKCPFQCKRNYFVLMKMYVLVVL